MIEMYKSIYIHIFIYMYVYVGTKEKAFKEEQTEKCRKASEMKVKKG